MQIIRGNSQSINMILFSFPSSKPSYQTQNMNHISVLHTLTNSAILIHMQVTLINRTIRHVK